MHERELPLQSIGMQSGTLRWRTCQFSPASAIAHPLAVGLHGDRALTCICAAAIGRPLETTTIVGPTRVVGRYPPPREPLPGPADCNLYWRLGLGPRDGHGYIISACRGLGKEGLVSFSARTGSTHAALEGQHATPFAGQRVV
jgi:hypothetical protein